MNNDGKQHWPVITQTCNASTAVQVWADFSDSEAEAIIRFEAGDDWHPYNSGRVYKVSYRCETCGFKTISRREIWDHAHDIEAHQ